MLKKSTWLAVAIVIFTFVMFVSSATAIQIDEANSTVLLNEEGETSVVKEDQYKEGKKLFGYACSSCHGQGMTKTNPNVGLELETLKLATPPRNNIEGLVAFLKAPMSFDGEDDISEEHPGINSADIFPKMRNLTEDNLVDLAAFLLVEPQVNERWAANKYSR